MQSRWCHQIGILSRHSLRGMSLVRSVASTRRLTHLKFILQINMHFNFFIDLIKQKTVALFSTFSRHQSCVAGCSVSYLNLAGIYKMRIDY